MPDRPTPNALPVLASTTTTTCPCKGTGTILIEGPCDAAPQEAPCPCLKR